jgi:hypothetical protein
VATDVDGKTGHILDIVANPQDSGAYMCLKDRLLVSAKKSDYQKADRLMSMSTLGDRRPSDIMATVLEQFPRGWPNEKLLAHLFLSRLPKHLRVLLRTRDTADLRALAEAADELHDFHLPSTGSQVNACLISSQDGPVVAAVAGGPSKAAKKPAGWLPLEQYKQQKQQKQQSKSKTPDPQEMEQFIKSGFCWAHFKYAGNAWNCGMPRSCAWGN